MRRVAAAAIVAFAITLMPTASTASARSDSARSAWDDSLHRLTNVARANHDRSELKFGRCLDRFAQRQARRMADAEEMYHQNLRTVLKKCKARAVGENVAYGYASPAKNIRAWMKSPGHRRNILSRSYTRLGIGVAFSKNGNAYTAQVFGRPR